MVYLIRQREQLEIYSESHLIGLFDQKIWFEILNKSGFTVSIEKLDDYYTPYIMGEGEYPLHMFICKKNS